MSSINFFVQQPISITRRLSGVSSLDSTFEKLLGRKSTPQERERLFRIKEVLNLSDDDSFWLIFYALEHYNTLYAVIPDAIRNAAEEQIAVLDKRALQAEYEVRAAIEKLSHETIRGLAVGVANAADKMAGQKARAQQWWGIAITVLLMWVFSGIVFTVGVVIGDRVPTWVIYGLRSDGLLQKGLAVAFNAPAGYVAIAMGLASIATWGFSKVIEVFGTGPK